MKKLLKKLLAGISVLTVMSMSILPASALAINETKGGNYTIVNDNGLLDDYYRTDYKIIVDSKGNLSLLNILENKFRFSLKSDILTDEVKTDVIKIISEYYPNNNFNESSDSEKEDYTKISVNSNGLYQIYLATVNDNDLEKIEKIRKSLEEKNYVSEFTALEYSAYQSPIGCYELRYSADDISFETLEQYIIDNQLDCTLETDDNSYYFNFTNEITTLQNFEIAADIYEKYNIKAGIVIIEIATPFNGTYSSDNGTTDFETIPIAGDLDLDNNTGLSDVLILSKYLANTEIYPITDETAKANADINKDGEINGLDTSILIEYLLGDYTNAF